MNTQLFEEEKELKQQLSEVCRIEKMSTFAIGAIINKTVAEMPEDQVYVNVGLWKGFSFLAGLVNNPLKKCIGIDNFSEFKGTKDGFMVNFEKFKSDRHEFCEMDYCDYFRGLHKDKIAFYFYDGEHSYENQLKGLQVAEPFLSKGCRILVDDTNDDQARGATLDFIQQSSHDYQLIFDQETACNGHPTFWNGIMLFQKKD